MTAERPATPAAKPSMPSMKLIMLTMATNHRIVSGYCIAPRLWTPSTAA